MDVDAPKPINGTPTAHLRRSTGGSPWAFHLLVWVYDSHMGASTPTVLYNYPPTLTLIASLHITFVDCTIMYNCTFTPRNRVFCVADLRAIILFG